MRAGGSGQAFNVHVRATLLSAAFMNLMLPVYRAVLSALRLILPSTFSSAADTYTAERAPGPTST